MSIALQIRVDELCRQVSDLTQRVRALEAGQVEPQSLDLNDVDPEPAKRKPGRPRKADQSDS